MVTRIHHIKNQLGLLQVSSSEELSGFNQLTFLSVREQELYYKKINSKKADWLLGRLTAKQCLNTYFRKSIDTDIDYNHLEVLPNDLGAPKIVIDSSLLGEHGRDLPNISISHVQGELAAAYVVSLGLGAGVDVERIRPWDEALVQSYLTKNEYEYICSNSPEERVKEATILWSLKEAYLKALGLGLRKHPQSIDMADFIVSENITTSVKNVDAGWQYVKTDFVLATVLLK